MFSSAERVRRASRAAARRAAPAAVLLCLLALPAYADKIANPIAVFNGLDKITGRIITFEVSLNETVQFGTLQVTPRVCYSRPPTDPPRTDAFAQVDEIDEQHKFKRIFSGWMFADSPGLHGVEHPIYDVWLVDCKGGTAVTRDAPPPTDTATTSRTIPPRPTPTRRPRRRWSPRRRRRSRSRSRSRPRWSSRPCPRPVTTRRSTSAAARLRPRSATPALASPRVALTPASRPR